MKSTAKAAEKRSRTVVVLAIAVALMLLGSIFAQMFNTSFYKVKVSRISFDTDSGTLSGLLYMPKGVDASNPHPTIVTTHGYLNSAEMQDETAIEMSRRGYVVLALDMYDHGHSHGNADNTGGFFQFWPTSLWDAAQYMYSQDYVAKDAQGNGQIAVSGHSMGGFSSEMAIYLDEQNYAAAGYRIIKAGLSMGADYSWTSYLSLDEEAAVATFGGRTIGKKVAEKLGVPCYDAEIIQEMAKETGFAPDYVKEAGEYAPGNFLSAAFSNRMFGPTNEDILWEHQYKVITELAEKGPCVIVGRCADYILRDKADCLKVFIHADMKSRAERIVKVYGEREQSPEERLRDKDKRRAAYHRFYTNMKWGHAQNYHLTLDSGVIGIDKCVDIIAELY